MLEKNRFPILEFDPCATAKIEPARNIAKKDVPQACVISYFGDIVQQKFESGLLTPIAAFSMAYMRLPVYETVVQNKRVGLVSGVFGAPGSARLLEELIATGFEKFIVCGGAGVLQKGLHVGHLVLPCAAVRDEGVSYHYVKPSREIECNPHALSVMEEKLKLEKLPYIKAKTWTTDACYRETDDKIALRVSEGCATVEMEAAALFAVARFRNVVLGQILYGGDDLSGREWDSRRWNSENSRANLIDLCLETALML